MSAPRRAPAAPRAPRAWLRFWPLLLALPAGAWLAARSDPGACARSLGELGAAAWLVPLPSLAGVALDAAAWRVLWPTRTALPSLWPLVRTRLSMDALALVLPGGGLIADSLAPGWLRRSCRLPLADGFALLALRKGLIVAAHALLLMLAAALAVGVLIGTAHAPLVLSASAAGLASLSVLGLRWLVSGRACAALDAGLARLPGPGLRRWRARQASRLAGIDRRLHALGRASPSRTLTALALLTASLTVEALETLLILRLLGVPVTLAQALPAEALLQLVRAAAFVVPAGLGVQDAGYALFLALCGLGDAVSLAAAFALVKRGREALTAAGGFALLLVARARTHARQRATRARRVASAGLLRSAASA